MALAYCNCLHTSGLQRLPQKDSLHRFARYRLVVANFCSTCPKTRLFYPARTLRKPPPQRYATCNSGIGSGQEEGHEKESKAIPQDDLIVNIKKNANETTITTVAAYASIALGLVSLITSVTYYSLPGLIFLIYWVAILRSKTSTKNVNEVQSDHSEALVHAELKAIKGALMDQKESLESSSKSVKQVTADIYYLKESTETLRQSQTILDSSLEDLQKKIQNLINEQCDQSNAFSSKMSDIRESASRYEARLANLESNLENQRIEFEEQVAALQTPDEIVYMTEKQQQELSPHKEDGESIVEIVHSEDSEDYLGQEPSRPQFVGQVSDQKSTVLNQQPSDAQDFDKSRIDNIYLDAGKFAQPPSRTSSSNRQTVSVFEWGIEQPDNSDKTSQKVVQGSNDKVRVTEAVKQAKLLVDSVIKSLETGKAYPSSEASIEQACRMFQESLDMLGELDVEDRIIARTHSLFGQALFLKGRIKKMIADDFPSAKYNEAESYYDLADETLIKCARQFRQAILLVPEDESAYFNWALALELRAQMAVSVVEEENLMIAAVEKLDRLIELNRKPTYLLSLGDTLTRLADFLEDKEAAEQYYEDALEIFDECLKANPNNTSALEGLRRCEMELDLLYKS